MNIDLKNLNIVKAHLALKNGEFTAVDLTNSCIDEIRKKDGEVNAFREVFEDALSAAKQADEKIANAKKENKDFGMLLGIPCAVKDNILIKGKIAGASSKILENYHAPYNATAIKKLAREGVVFIGRTNMDEFAMGGSTENSAYGVTKNPYDISCVAGGSSGGSAVAVAMNGCLFALGSDTGGSIRQPSSFCGVVGLKPTYGAVSRYGLMAMGSSLDQIGPITKTVDDAKIVFDVIKGRDEKDGTTLSDSAYTTNPSSKKMTIGVPRHFLKEGVADDVMHAFEKTLENLKNKGHTIKDISLPNISSSLMVYYIIMPAEVSSNMARYDGIKYGLHVDGKDVTEDYFKTRRQGFGKEVIRRILLGTYVLSSGYYDAYYNRANAIRSKITDDFIKAFDEVEIIATPTCPSSAFKIGKNSHDPVSMYLEDIFTVPANLTGIPAISVPMGFVSRDQNELPIGIQFSASHGNEHDLFRVGRDVSQE